MLEIKDAVAVITGGSGGIGMALAKYWLSKGGKAVLADVAEEALEKAKTELGGDVATMVCDVTNEDDCGKLADTAIERFGGINLVAPFAGIIKDGLLLHGSGNGQSGPKNAPGGFSKGRGHQSDRCLSHGPRVHGEDDQSSLYGADLSNFFYRFVGNCRADQLRVHQSRYVGHAAGHYSRIFPARSGAPNPCLAMAPGYVGTQMVKSMNQRPWIRSSPTSLSAG